MPIRITANRIYFNDGSYIETANINPGDGFASGTKMFFYQTTPPTGWTKVTTYNNTALRVVSGTASTYTTGMDFTSTFNSSRIVSGTVSISLADHSFTTGATTPSISLQSSSVSGLNFSSPTIDNSGTINVSVSADSTSITTTSGSADVSNSPYFSISRVSTGMDSHSHSTPNTDISISYYTGTFHSDELGTQLTVLDPNSSPTKNYVSATTGSYGSGSDHEHGQGTVSMTNNGNHNHSVDLSHSHSPATTVLSNHNHTNYSISGSFDSSGTHTHTVTAGSHSHTASLSHSVSASFSGNAMNFSVNYVDLILAQKD
jgi:hypothetical protein